MGSREDDDWFNAKYAEPVCDIHDEDELYFHPEKGETICAQCEFNDEMTRIYKYG